MIHIKELFRLQDIQHLRLIAGRDGLERTVTAAVLFEYDPSRVQLPDFYRGDLVVTTLAYARGDAQLVAHSLQALMNQGIASLMVKTAYFSELPQSVIALANRLGTPVFLFDDTYIEEVILQVTDLIRGKRHFSGFEQDVDALMRGDLTEEQTRERARRIDPVGHGRYRLYAVNPRERVLSLDDRLYALLETDADAARRCTFIEWRRMMLALCREEDGLTAEEVKGVVIAYEPVWAIGTGLTATPDQAEEVCEMIRSVVRKLYSSKNARAISILYGGSMNDKNAFELLAQPDIDGGLIGGASLVPEKFVKIIEAANQPTI